MNEWNIQNRANACTACGKSFADKETYHTFLFEQNRQLRRSDLCNRCWSEQSGQKERNHPGFISYWQGVFEVPPPAAELVRKETAESLLRKLVEVNDPRYVPAGYILAVMLERKRMLKVREQLVLDGKRVFIYEQPATGDVFTIVDPNLQLHQLEQVQREVADLLEHGFASPAPETPAVAGASTQQPQPPQAASLPVSG